MKPNNMDDYLQKRANRTFEMYDYYTGCVNRNLTLQDMMDNPSIKKCDIRNVAKLRIGQTVGRLGSLVWHFRRIG